MCITVLSYSFKNNGMFTLHYISKFYNEYINVDIKSTLLISEYASSVFSPSLLTKFSTFVAKAEATGFFVHTVNYLIEFNDGGLHFLF